MIDLNKMADELTDAFIGYQDSLESPMMFNTEEIKLAKYRKDSIFHSKVQSLVCGVMRIVSKHIDEGEG